ncbi:MAG: OmpA family protein [Roseinatronobacter sp.]
MTDETKTPALRKQWQDALARPAFMPRLLMIAAFLAAAVIAYGSAVLAVRGIEHVVERDSRAVLAEKGLGWAQVSADGLLLTLSGEAASEAVRFRAISAVSTVVAAERVIDEVSVAASMQISAPAFQIEVLRNTLDVSMIGLVPADFDVAPLIARIEGIDPEMSVVNMLETASHPVPFGWEDAVAHGLDALKLIPISKISITAGNVEITGLATTARDRDAWRDTLTRNRPRNVISSINISAPRPVITPFTLRFVIDEEGARFDACSADTNEARDAILRAARAAGAQGVLPCTIGLGSPTPRWQAGAVEAIRALAALGEGTVTIADADIALVVPATITPDAFDTAVGALENRLPDVFSLTGTRLAPTDDDLARAGEALEFVASLSNEGRVVLRGRVTDERLRDAVQSLAQAEFGLPAVQMVARVDPDLPEGWPIRAMLAVDILSQLAHGQVRVRPDRIDVTGVTGDKTVSDDISRVMAEKLGHGVVFNLNITYDERFDPIANQPTPARCERWIDEILAEQKITFDPGSVSIGTDAGRVLDRIAGVLRDCGRLEMEIGGHTDSQGRLETNMRLSQQRADAVKAGLIARGVPVSNFEARGFGPEFPIADNSTAAGREANRRIEFRLIGASAEAAEAERAGAQAPPDATEVVMDESALEIVVTEGAGDGVRPPPRPDSIQPQ